MDLEENSEQDRLLSISPTNTDVFYKVLSNILQSNDFCSFEKAIIYKKQSTNILNINYIDLDTKETYLDTASKNGQTEFVEFLLRQGAKPNRVNELQNRAPIHFATEGGHVDMLAVLLAEPTIKPNLEAGQQTALHIAVKRNDLTCADLLLTKGASINIPNSKGMTALHLAAIKSNRDMVKLILEKSQQRPDIDTYRDYNDWTAREVIQQKLPDIILPPKYENREINGHDLKYYLIANDETNFLKNMELVKIEILDSVAEELLEMTVQRNFYKSVIKILEKLKGRQFNVKKAAEAAVLYSHSAILQELLCVEPTIANDLVLSACQQLGIPEKLKINNTSHQIECLKLILEQDVNVHCTDNKGNTPLHYAATADCAEAITLLLNRGSYIGHMNTFDIPPIADIPASMLSHYFDDCLRMTKEYGEYKIEFDYRCLMPHNILKKHDETRRLTCEMEVFKYIASNNDLKHLLKHPILSSFLFLKWHRIRYIMWVKFFFYLIFFSVLNLLLLRYVFSMNNPPNENSTYIANNSCNMTLEKPLQIVYQNDFSLTVIIYLLLLPFTLWKILQCCFCPLYYLITFENLLQFIIVVLTIVLMVSANFEIGIILILLSAWEVIILISQLGVSGTSTSYEMFQKVTVNYMCLFFPYIIIIIEFALIFFILFKSNNAFCNLERSFFKTIIMLTGEFEASNIILHSIFSHIIFTLFVFFIAIVLFNLLNGLAVNNTAEILSEAEITKLISKIHVIAFIEEIAVGKVFRCYFCCRNSKSLRWNPFSFLARSIFLFPHYLRDGKFKVKLNDSVNNHYCNKFHKVIMKYCNACNEYINRNKCWITQMDSNIIRQAKQIVLNKNQLSDNEKIIMEITKLREQIAAIKA